MHARVADLLSLRDGEPVDVAVREHVERCRYCASALAETTAMRDRMRALPAASAVAAEVEWLAVVARLARRQAVARRHAKAARLAAVASIAIVAVAVSWRLADAPGESLGNASAGIASPTAAEALAQDRVAQLQLQSAALEELLATLGSRPVVQRAGTALPIDTLEAQVQWVDHRLLGNADDAVAAEQLWRERVQAMDSLVRLRYVEASRVAL